MKRTKTISVILSFVMIFSLLLTLSGCGENPKKQEATDAFNKVAVSFDEVANLINANADAIDGELVSVFQEMSSLLTQYKDLLEGSDELTDEKYDEMITWFGTAESWIKEAKAGIETMISENS